MIDVLCIGHACYDINLYLDSYPRENSKMEIHELLESGGGPAANAAFLLSRWNARCAFAGLIGDDSYGQRVVEEFKSVGTDISFLDVRKGHITPFSVILVNGQNGSRTIINRKAKDMYLTSDKVRFNGICPKVLLFDGHELQASLAALEQFPHAISILDAGSLREGTKILAGKVDYLVASERFVLSVSGLPGVENRLDLQKCMESLRNLNNNQVVVTLGERGLVYDDQGNSIHMPAFSANTVDTTAAGDIFHGAFTYGILKNMKLRDILSMASMAASLSVCVQGGRRSIPSLGAVEMALQNTQINSSSLFAKL